MAAGFLRNGLRGEAVPPPAAGGSIGSIRSGSWQLPLPGAGCQAPPRRGPCTLRIASKTGLGGKPGKNWDFYSSRRPWSPFLA